MPDRIEFYEVQRGSSATFNRNFEQFIPKIRKRNAIEPNSHRDNTKKGLKKTSTMLIKEPGRA